MSYLRLQDEDESSVAGTVTSVLLGAVAGFAVGMFVAQRVGGFSGLANRVRRGLPDGLGEMAGGQPAVADDYADYDDYEDDELEASEEDSELEERVLEAFRNDPIMSERAVDIGGIGDATIELAGWVNSEEEAEHAVVLARGVPGVDTVVNRIAIGEEEERVRDNVGRFAAGEDTHTEAHWEGRTVGTGRRRQGNSAEVDRHADPRIELEERTTAVGNEVLMAAEDIGDITAERRYREKKVVKGDRTGGSPIAPTGVPKADHVVNPTETA
jgi:osmotically-inducible protein OsmY